MDIQSVRMKISELVKNNRVWFDSYRAGFFYYNVSIVEYDGNRPYVTHYQFTVPIEDIGNATLLASDKAITYMRWIRKAIESKTLIKVK